MKRATDACVLASNNASPAQRGPRRDAQPLHATPLAAVLLKERKKTDTPNEGWDEGQGPHLHEQDFGRTIRGTGGALLLLTRDTTGSQRGARWTPTSTGGLISV